MWKKNEEDLNEPVVSTTPSVKREPVGERAVIGASLVVKGDLSGDEDLIIQGQVEGKVFLKKNSVTVGKNGRVKADIYAKSVYVEGSVQGNLNGEEKIVIRQSGNVRGNASAPRVTLEDGARFKGSIDMDGKATEKQPSLPSTAESPRPALSADKATSGSSPKVNQPRTNR